MHCGVHRYRGRIRVGWVSARVQFLPVRPLQCFKCMELGHVRVSCTSAVVRSGACYTSGATGHFASSCVEPLRCPACAESGLFAAHRIDSMPSCKAAGKAARKKKGGSGVLDWLLCGLLSPPAPGVVGSSAASGGMAVESVAPVRGPCSCGALGGLRRYGGHGGRRGDARRGGGDPH
ncbi:hypothetical protein ALC62_02060 [Cyphomyrmex costatus]|uniref:CCHC-type domain-containing protein n=1 Tax=Cyphomyrmex costatus TaxID=456900 RepID=A0A151IND8_9HYME|nr:hypothetical protein ALC62_02060 [Cyphomyrmex costatus]